MAPLLALLLSSALAASPASGPVTLDELKGELKAFKAARKTQDDPLLERAKQLAGKVSPEPSGLESILGDEVPAAEYRAALAKLHAELGGVETIIPLKRETRYWGYFDARFSKGFRLTLTLTVEPDAPHKITGAHFGAAYPTQPSLKAVLEALQKLPGRVNFQLERLSPEPAVIASLNPDEELGIASAFKLYILAALVKDRKPWDSVVRLQDRWKSLPSGELHNWPAGAPLTVYDLAGRMISRSDNTATDHLLFHAGRGRIESLLPEFGHAHPARMTPFLSTRELFLLKGRPSLARAYLPLDAAGRRRFLDETLAKTGREEHAAWETPRALDTLEWFASAADLCRVMAWLDKHGDKEALDILRINPGIPLPPGKYYSVGFKGGSEPGVLNLTLLVKTLDGASYALSAGWNDPAANLDDNRFLAPILSAFDHIPAVSLK
jgi:hypothetical protein